MNAQGHHLDDAQLDALWEQFKSRAMAAHNTRKPAEAAAWHEAADALTHARSKAYRERHQIHAETKHPKP